MEWNRRRTLKMVLGYMFFSTPLYSFAYTHIFHRLFPGNTWPMALGKVSLDAFMMAPIHGTSFMAYSVICDGGNLDMVIAKVKRDWFPLWSLGLKFVPILQLINFAYVPARFNVHYLMGISAGWSILLSFYVNKPNPEIVTFGASEKAE